MIEQKTLDFNNLIHRNDSVHEYTRRFLQFERFYLGLMENKKAICNKFFWG